MPIKFVETSCYKGVDEQRRWIGPTLQEQASAFSMREQLNELHDGVGEKWWLESQEDMWIIHEYLEREEQDRRDAEALRNSDLRLYTQDTPSEFAERLWLEDWENDRPDYNPEWEYGGRIYPGTEPRDLRIRRQQIGNEVSAAYNYFFE